MPHALAGRSRDASNVGYHRFANALADEIRGILKKNGSKVISEVTVQQAYGGMRGVKGMICDTSVVEPDKGLIVRGRPLLEIKHLWPEEVFFLLLTGEMPDAEAGKTAIEELNLKRIAGRAITVNEARPRRDNDRRGGRGGGRGRRY